MARAILTITLATVAVLFVQFSSVQSCKCLPLPKPSQCRTDYLALVKITGVKVDAEQRIKQYSFELITDLSYSTTRGTLRGAHFLETAQHTATCGAELALNTTYLIGGQFTEQTHQPYIFTCHAYIEEWHLTGAKSTSKLAEYKRECDEFHKEHSL